MKTRTVFLISFSAGLVMGLGLQLDLSFRLDIPCSTHDSTASFILGPSVIVSVPPPIDPDATGVESFGLTDLQELVVLDPANGNLKRISVGDVLRAFIHNSGITESPVISEPI